MKSWKRSLRYLRLVPGRIAFTLLSPLRWIRVISVWIAYVFRVWRKSASFGHLIRSLPTIVVGATSLFTILAIKSTADSTIRNEYSSAAGLALAGQDYEAARIYYERVYAMDGRQEKTLFRLALVEQAAGNIERCEKLMREISPRQKAVYAPAHLWQAERLLNRPQITRDDVAAAEAQLTQVVHLEPENVRAHHLLGQIMLSSGNLERAASQLLIAAEQLPEARMLLARVLVLQGKPEEGGRVARSAQQALRLLLEGNPNDVASRLLMADATMFLEEFPEAVALINAGLRLEERMDLRRALAQVYITWSDNAHREHPTEIATRLKLLENAILSNPTDMNLFGRLTDMLLNEDDESTHVTKENLERLLAEGKAPRLIHMVLGTSAGEKGDTTAAVFHLQTAFELDPNMPIAANNLAWYLLLSDPPKAAEALTIIDVLVTRWPEVWYYRDTRGHAYAKLGRWKEAIADLELAVEAKPENKSAHQVLAEAYRHLGIEGLALQHEAIANAEKGGR